MEYIYGKNPVIELLKSGYEVSGIFLEDSQAKRSFFKEVHETVSKYKKTVKFSRFDRDGLTRLCGSPDHQGVVASFEGFVKTPLRSYLGALPKGTEAFLFVLDCIHDPHNMGAILRSSHAMGISGCVVFDKRSAKMNATVAKTSAGAIFHSNIITSDGIAAAIAELKKAGFSVWGCEMGAARDVFEIPLAEGRHAVILGNEGEGMTGRAAERTDGLIKVPMASEFDSLNVSVTAGIIAYEYLRQKLGRK